MAPIQRKEASRSRAATKELRRQQLIESTIDSIARRGFSETTLANVATGAGLSRGIVNFHFQSKDALLVATLQHLAEEYRSLWTRAIAKASPGAAERLRAMVEADLDPAVCNRKKVAVWYAFWGEAKSRPTYLELCDASDEEYFQALQELCLALVREGEYHGLDGRLIAQGLSAMMDGLWLDLLLKPSEFDRDTSRRACLAYLSSVFPRHFSLEQRSAA